MQQPRYSVRMVHLRRPRPAGHDLDAKQRVGTNVILHSVVCFQDYDKALELVPSSVLALYRKAQVLRALHKLEVCAADGAWRCIW
jgi:hypothetical protein